MKLSFEEIGDIFEKHRYTVGKKDTYEERDCYRITEIIKAIYDAQGKDTEDSK